MIDLEWVSDYIDISKEDVYDLAKKITEAGINVEKVITKHIDNLVIGEVISCVPHPSSDHLHVCKVKVNNQETKQIVCGASNVKESLKVITALPGALLPGDFLIKKSVIRGQESEGMLCALFELGLEEKTPATYAKGIAELPSDAPIGEDAMKYLGLDDTIYELDIHKHRNNDCYYHIGFAYEIASILGKKVNLPESNYHEIEDNINNHFKLEVKTTKCPYYLAKMVTNVEIKPSPDFIKRRLTAAGMRSINNVVDISNYVMLEYGQPMHFFDKDHLGEKILVRDAIQGEEIITLDGQKRQLIESDILITDGQKPVCIAGVMGGENTEIEPNTKNILIESAIFDGVSIRNTSSRLDLKSEASIHYGKGLNYEYTKKALDRACYLLEKYANAKVLSGIASHDKVEKTVKKVIFKVEEINKMLGITIKAKDMEQELQKLDFPYQLKDETFTVEIPKRRLDIDANVNDIAEEIGRLYGYQNLVSTLPKTTIRKGGYIGDVKYKKMISKHLRMLGLTEAKTYTLVSPSMSNSFNYENKSNITVNKAMSVDKSVIRTTLIPSLLNVYDYNKKRGVKDVMIYEISKTYDATYTEDTKITILMTGNYLKNSWQNKFPIDFYVIKGIIENLLNYLGFQNRYQFLSDEIKDMHPFMSARITLDRKNIGIIGRIHPNLNKDNIFVAELSMKELIKDVKPIKYKPSSKYPSIVKDMAFIIDKDVVAENVIKAIKNAGGRLLTNVEIFDVYVGEKLENDKKSLAFSLTFEDNTKTLTDDVVMPLFEKVIKEVERKFKATLRDN